MMSLRFHDGACDSARAGSVLITHRRPNVGDACATVEDRRWRPRQGDSYPMRGISGASCFFLLAKFDCQLLTEDLAVVPDIDRKRFPADDDFIDRAGDWIAGG